MTEGQDTGHPPKNSIAGNMERPFSGEPLKWADLEAIHAKLIGGALSAAPLAVADVRGALHRLVEIYSPAFDADKVLARLTDDDCIELFASLL